MSKGWKSEYTTLIDGHFVNRRGKILSGDEGMAIFCGPKTHCTSNVGCYLTL